MSRIVVSLGETAFVDGSLKPNDRIQATAAALVPLVSSGHQVIICHGDNTLVGLINLVFEMDSRRKVAPSMPFAECTAMSEGYMGFHLAQELDNLLMKTDPQKIPTVTVLTQAVVEEDTARTEGIGPFFTKEKAHELMSLTGDSYAEAGADGWRRVFPAARPVGFREDGALRALLANHSVIIAAGGGGIPVARTKDGFQEVAAVVEVDFSAEKLAEILDADCLLLLCSDDEDIPEKPTLQTSAQARAMAEDKSCSVPMKQQLEAAALFADSGPGRRAVLSRFGQAAAAVDARAGVVVE